MTALILALIALGTLFGLIIRAAFEAGRKYDALKIRNLLLKYTNVRRKDKEQA